MHVVYYDLNSHEFSDVSLAPRGYYSYRFGDLRGGTNAIELDDYYLSFFHSYTQLPRNAVRTYFMGAYTFTKQKPFRLLSVSPQPIVEDWLYSGSWDPIWKRVDYAIFPMSLILLPDNATLLLSFGRQDTQGFYAHISLSKLLETFEQVVYCDGNSHHYLPLYQFHCTNSH
jgi:predicted GH43/DUF377 family glycosyl hydrolase